MDSKPQKDCRDCKDLGQRVQADRVLNGGTGVCNRHFRARMGMPAIAQETKIFEKGLTMKKSIDWEAVQRDRDAGTPVSELEKKYGVSNPTIYTKTHGSKNGNNRAGGAKKARPSKRGSFKATGENGEKCISTAALVAALRTRRDALTAAIAALEGGEA